MSSAGAVGSGGSGPSSQRVTPSDAGAEMKTTKVLRWATPEGGNDGQSINVNITNRSFFSKYDEQSASSKWVNPAKVRWT